MATYRKQSTGKLLMTDPIGFCYNEQTAASNAFQKKTSYNNIESEYLARKEFNLFVDQLIQKGIDVLVANGHKNTPDAVFPNNVFGTTHEGRFYYFPMANENRRQEREIGYDQLLKNIGYNITEIIHLYELEQQGQFLEGTGSMIFHHPSKTIFMTRSIRSQENALNAFCSSNPHNVVLLNALDAHQKEIYHTNVVISIGSKWMVACLDAITDKEAVQSWCDENQMTLIEINMDQMNDFGANILEVEGKNDPLGVFSETAWNAYDAQQKRALEKFLEPLIVSIPTIETIGGGSARCMMAEIFLP